MEIQNCNVCGSNKNPEVFEVYPYPEEGRFITEPIPPLLEIDCQPGDPAGIHGDDWKTVLLCHECWHRIDPDMWTCQEHYEALNPVTPYDRLPDLPDRSVDK